MPLKKIFEDNFDSGTKLKFVRPYYGSYSVSGGNLIINVADGVGNDWWSGVYRAPILYLDNIGSFYTGDEESEDRISGKVHIAETKITSISSSGSNCVGGMCLFTKDRINAVNFLYNVDSSTIGIDKGYDGTFSAVCNSPVVVDPSVSSHIYRIIWNYTPYPISYDWFDTEVAGNSVAFFYSDDDGVSFVNVGCAYTFEFSTDDLCLGLYLKNWSPYPESNISFDYLRYYQAYTETQKYKKTESGFEDDFLIHRISGKEKHKNPFNETDGLFYDKNSSVVFDDLNFHKTGPIRKYKRVCGIDRDPIKLPGSASNQDFDIGRELGGFYDRGDTDISVFLKTADSSINYFLEMPAGAFVPGKKDTYDPEITRNKDYFAFEDDGFAEISIPDYCEGRVDIHGNDYLYSSVVKGMFFYDSSNDMWNSISTDTGYYGARRDGVFVYDGYICGPGNFGTLANGFNNVSWGLNEPMGVGGADEIDCSIIDDDKLGISTSTTWSGGKGKVVRSSGRWYMVSDFEIEVSWENFSGSASDGGFGFIIKTDNKNMIYVRRKINNTIDSDVYRNGSWISYVSTPITETSGKFRFKRTFNLIEVYYDVGGGWVFLRNYTHDVFAGEVYVGLDTYLNTPTTNFNVDVFGFAITSGITTNLVGWAREGFSTNRGLNADFPVEALIVCTDKSIEIIDTENDLMWMRFIASGSSSSDCHALPFFGDGARPRQVYMDNGLLMISYSTEEHESVDGGAIFIDFSLDEIRIFREESDSITGASFGTWNGTWFTQNGQIGIDSTNGIVAARNLDAGYYTDRNSWSIQTNKSRCCHILEDNGYIYRAIATPSGITINKWRRWYLYGDSSVAENINDLVYAHSSETDDMGWCWFDRFTGDLFYMSSSKLFRVRQSVWELTLTDSGGTFSADTIVNPVFGTRTYVTQNHFVYDYNTNSFYIPADEGVYKIDWTTRVVTFFYGKEGSSAEYDLFNSDYNRVLMVDVKVDEMIPYLIVGVEFGDRKNTSGIVFAIDLNDNVVYSKSAIDFGKPIKAIAT